MKRFGRGRLWADLAGVAVVLAAVMGVVAVEAAQDPDARQKGAITPKVAMESHGKLRTAAEPVSDSAACGGGDTAACARGYEKWIELQSCQMGTNRSSGPPRSGSQPICGADMGSAGRRSVDPARVEALHGACQQGSRRACTDFSALMDEALAREFWSLLYHRD